MSDTKRIVIVGGGAGGVELATRLGHKLGRRGRAEITLVDANPTHIWKPLLHEVATGALDQSLDEVSYQAHARNHGYRFQLGRMTGLDRTNRELQLAPVFDDAGRQILGERSIGYDYLVLALGSVCNDFGTPGVAEHCHFLDSTNQAEVLRKGLLNAFLQHSGDQSNHPKRLSVAIVGAGATGVELSAELLSATELLASYGYTDLEREHLDVHLIEAAPGVLPALPERIGAAASRQLDKLGIMLHAQTLITRADSQGLVTKGGERIDADLCIWAAGVRAASFVSELGLTTRDNHQVRVQPNLISVDDERILAIGDCAACPMGEQGWVPPRAQSAHQMANRAYHNLLALLRDKPPRDFQYRDFGSLISLSHFTAIGNLMGGSSTGRSVFIEGMLARLFYVSLYRLHQRALHGTFKTVLKIIVDGINSMLRPKMKLH